MTSRRTQEAVPYSAAQMFALVADVERYPEFLPHCVALRVAENDVTDGEGVIIADMVVSYKAFREKFRSHVTLDRENLQIETTYLDGPFRKLHNLWTFEDTEHGSLIDFRIDFQFRNVILQATAAAVFERAFAKMADAFIDRADAVYGATATSPTG